MGMAVEDIEPAAKRGEPTSPPAPSTRSAVAAPPTPSAPAAPPPDHPVAAALVTVFRILAAVCAVLVAINVFAVMDDSSKHGSAGTAALTGAMLQGVIVVAILLAIAEGLRLAIAIEKNTRSRGPASAPDRMRRRGK